MGPKNASAAAASASPPSKKLENGEDAPAEDEEEVAKDKASKDMAALSGSVADEKGIDSSKLGQVCIKTMTAMTAR